MSESAPVKHPGTNAAHPLVVAGRYPRESGEIRIVAFGDSDFASNRYLRTLYNLDLVLNAVHWAIEREPEITVRPKIRDTVQFPIPVENTLLTLELNVLMPYTPHRLDSFDDLEAIELEVARPCELQIDLGHTPDLADAFQLLDASPGPGNVKP